jgi:predicted unusual protein kinase regulating ubiquinone biosynthesis (AarF/ABC1/UbiB family)
MDDTSKIIKKAGRYASMSTSVAGVALQLVGEKFLGVSIDRDAHSANLMAVLGKFKGPIMKVAQILATIPNALPPEYAKAFQELQANAPAMGWPFVRRRMKAELGADWQANFAEFPKQATAAASLGQVHKAQTLEGDWIACKLQYPDMMSAVDADLAQLKMLLKMYKQYDSSIVTEGVHAELSDRLREELDYKREANVQRLYAHLLKDEPHVHVPSVVDELSTDRLLTTQWVDGKRVFDFENAPLEDRNQIALNLFKAWYVPLYKTGIIHGDPHPGNYTVRDDLSINLLDFGCVRIFNPEFVGAVIDLYNSLKNKDEELAIISYKTWGFGDLNKETIEILNVWAGFLYGPILDDNVRTIGSSDEGVYGQETAREVHKKLRELRAGLPIPREFVFMDRAALGIGSICIRLQSEINWYRLFNEMIDGFDVDDVRARQNAILPKYSLKSPAD